MEVELENLTGSDIDVSQASLTDTQGWAVPGHAADVRIGAGQVLTVTYPVAVPGGTAPGTTDSFTLNCHLGTDPISIDLGSGAVGLPLAVTKSGQTDLVPGNSQATIPIEIVSPSLTSVSVSYQATSSQGFPVTVQAPATIQAGQTVQGSLVMPIPPDPSLVGSEGTISLTITDANHYTAQTTLPYTIEPAVSVVLQPVSIYTGQQVGIEDGILAALG